VITYEYPLNERIRTLLRLEDLFEKVMHFVRAEGSLEHHVALVTLFEILEVASRADLKVDLVQELERQRQILLSFRNNPQIPKKPCPAPSTRSSRRPPPCSPWPARPASTCARTSG
jgi:cell division protein ZapD